MQAGRIQQCKAPGVHKVLETLPSGISILERNKFEKLMAPYGNNEPSVYYPPKPSHPERTKVPSFKIIIIIFTEALLPVPEGSNG